MHWYHLTVHFNAQRASPSMLFELIASHDTVKWILTNGSLEMGRWREKWHCDYTEGDPNVYSDTDDKSMHMV